MNLSEAEIQVLASLQAAELDAAPTDRATLEKGGERFWIFLEDWSEAFPSLVAKGLIDGDESGYRLTESGRPLGYSYNRERPDKYWYYYRRFYPAAFASATHSRLCEGVFGKDLCQEGMVDMAALEDILARLALKPGDELLNEAFGICGLCIKGKNKDRHDQAYNCELGFMALHFVHPFLFRILGPIPANPFMAHCGIHFFTSFPSLFKSEFLLFS